MSLILKAPTSISYIFFMIFNHRMTQACVTKLIDTCTSTSTIAFRSEVVLVLRPVASDF